jgi:glycosyltransferase involved in cell wall biosynthesis
MQKTILFFLKKKIKIIENFINIKNKKKLLNKNESDYFKILIISRLENKQKNINNFLYSIKKINEDYLNKIKISIIGDGVDFKIINNTIKELKLNNCVDIIKPISFDISSYYLNANLFIIPSKWEGVSNSLLEAMSYGLPVIALKRCQGMKKFVINDYNGYLVENENELIIFQDLIEELIDNKTYLKKLGRNSIEVIKRLNMVDDKIQWRDLLNDT